MSVKIKPDTAGKALVVHASGKLSKQDYEWFVPEVEQAIKNQGKVRILLELADFHGWEIGALWEDIKFDMKHFRDIEKLAVVGESKWQQGMATFCKPFTSATIRYFDHGQLKEAETWIDEA